MAETFDKNKIIECMFDQKISEILVELENGKKEVSYIAKKFKISENELLNLLEYLLKHDFVTIKSQNGKKFLSADSNKLAKAMENDENFKGITDGLTEMDSFLN